MATSEQPPLNWESSRHSEQTASPSLPDEVSTCLKNARFLHLATCVNNTPHISLMNYTYLSSSDFHSSPTILMTTNPSSRKVDYLTQNPKVSLLVHDWVSHRPPTVTRDPERSGSPPPVAARSSLAAMLLNINTAALSRISATINGEARILPVGSEEEEWCKARHLDNHTFDQENEGNGLFGLSRSTSGTGDEERGKSVYIEGEGVRVIVVTIKDGTIADWKGGVRDFIIEGGAGDGGNGTTIPNGI